MVVGEKVQAPPAIIRAKVELGTQHATRQLEAGNK